MCQYNYVYICKCIRNNKAIEFIEKLTLYKTGKWTMANSLFQINSVYKQNKIKTIWQQKSYWTELKKSINTKCVWNEI